MLLCERIKLAAFIWILFRTKFISSFDVKRLGCYHDKGYRALVDTHHDDRMTLELCMKLCYKHRYLELQASNECFCDNLLGKANVFQKISDSECQLPCKGNTSEICGGVFANSVYELIPVTVTTTKITTSIHSTMKTIFMTRLTQSTVTTRDMTTPGHSTVKTTNMATPGQFIVKTTELTTPGYSTMTTTEIPTPGQSTVKTISMTIPTQSKVTITQIPSTGQSTVKTTEITIPRYFKVTTGDIITLDKSEVPTTDKKIHGRSPGTSLQVTEPRTLEVTTIKTTPIITSVQSIIPLVTSVQLIIPSECLCPCSTIGKTKYDFLRGMNLPRDQLREILKQELDLIKKELSVNKSNTTRMRRSKVSAPDDRVSATSVGYVGVVCIFFIGFLVVFFDILGCFVVKFKRRSSLQL